VLQRALILQSGETLSGDEIAFETLSGAEQNPVTVEVASTFTAIADGQDLRSQEQRHILDMLEKNQGSRRLTARELGISERTLRYKIARFRDQGVDIPDKTGKKSA
jgi:two-component system response regulator FlrC